MDEFTHPIILRRKRRGIKPEVIQMAYNKINQTGKNSSGHRFAIIAQPVFPFI
jgi:hypothetical protein